MCSLSSSYSPITLNSSSLTSLSPAFLSYITLPFWPLTILAFLSYSLALLSRPSFLALPCSLYSHGPLQAVVYYLLCVLWTLAVASGCTHIYNKSLLLNNILECSCPLYTHYTLYHPPWATQITFVGPQHTPIRLLSPCRTPWMSYWTRSAKVALSLAAWAGRSVLTSSRAAPLAMFSPLATSEPARKVLNAIRIDGVSQQAKCQETKLNSDGPPHGFKSEQRSTQRGKEGVGTGVAHRSID